MDSKPTAQSEDSSANADLGFLSASALAASGMFEEAQALLCQDGQLPSTPQALDLLARIATQSGDFARARKLWEAALHGNPSYEPAKKALDSLGTPWFVLAVTKRIAFLVFLTAAACLAIIGLFALLHLIPPPASNAETPIANRLPAAPRRAAVPDQRKPIEQPASVTTNDSAEALRLLKESLEWRAGQLGAQIQVLHSNQAQLLEGQAKVAEQVVSLAASHQALTTQQRASLESVEQARRELRTLAEVRASDRRPVTNSVALPAPLPPLTLSVDGVSVHPHHGGWEISFDAALFDRDDHFKFGSKSLLESTAKALVRAQEKISVQVVGFAEAEPPRWPWSGPRSEAELGHMRAERVKRQLEHLAIFPPHSLSATSGLASDRPRPSANSSNRTVILRIFPQYPLTTTANPNSHLETQPSTP